MKKIFRLASAEFNKIFYRPSIFILTALLVMALVFSTFYFKPISTVNKLTYAGTNVQQIYDKFTTSSPSANEITKITIDKKFEQIKKELDNDYYNLVSVDKHQEFINKISTLTNYYESNFLQRLLLIVQMTQSEFTPAKKQETINIFKELRTKCSAVTDYMASSIKNQKLNFYFKQQDYEYIFNTFIQLNDDLNNDYSTYTKKDFESRGESIRTKYKDFLEGNDKTNKIAIISQKINSFEKISLDAKDFKNLIDTYYVNAVSTLNDVYFKNVETIYQNKHQSNLKIDMNSINEAIAQYNSFASLNMTILKNDFTLLHIGNKSDSELKSLVGFNETSKYNLTEQSQIAKYLIENNKFDYDYSTNYNFNVCSTNTPNAFDYTFFVMQILSVLITIFTIFYVSSSIAGDQSNGTMKMIATRPFSRNKLFSGKFLSCFLFSTLLLAVSFIASFVVGIASYGTQFSNCLIAFNATVVVEMSPFLIMLLYFLSLSLNLLFYISLSAMISLICKSSPLSVLITSFICVINIILNGLINAPWLKYIPFSHLDLFKYLGNSHFGILSNNILPDTNFVLSFGIIFGSIVFMNIVSHLLFKRKDIA